MQIKNKFLPTVVAIISLVIGISSCNKADKIVLKSEGTITMPQAFSTRGQISLLLLDTPQAVIFGAAYGGLKSAGQDIAITFKVDTNAIATYNAKNGTSYISFPSSSYTVSSLNGTIKAGETSSIPLTVNFSTKSLDAHTKYMLPITISNISSGILDSSLKTTYFSIDKLANIYEGSYHTTGTRLNYNSDGTLSGSSSIDDTRVLTTLSSDSCSINTIANLGAYNGTVFYVKVNKDNTLKFSGFLQNDPGAPIANQSGIASTYDPATKSFTVHYKYTNTNGTYRVMNEVWTHD